MVDAIAHRYGQSPAEVLRWDPHDLTIAAICIADAQARGAARVRSINDAGGMVFPVHVIGS